MRFTHTVTAGLVLAAISSLTNAGVVPHPVRSKTELDVTKSADCGLGKGLCPLILPNVNKRTPATVRPGKGPDGPDGPGGTGSPGGSESPGSGSSSQTGDQTGPGQGAGEGGSSGSPSQTGDQTGTGQNTGDTTKNPGDTTTNTGDTTTNSGDQTGTGTEQTPKKSGDETDGTTNPDIACTGRKRCTNDIEPDLSPARINQPLEYNTAQQNGQSVLSDAESRITLNTPKDTFVEPSRGYTLSRDTDPDSDSDVDMDAEPFRGDSIDHSTIFTDKDEPAFNIDPNTPAPSLTFESIVAPPKNKDPAQNFAVNNAKINTENGLMMASVRDKSADGNVAANTGATIPSHELSWRMWAKQCSDDDVPLNNLKMLVAESAQGKGTQDTLFAAIASTEKNKGVDMSVKDSKAVFTPDPNDPAMFAAFKAMAGTDNVRPFGQMIAQNQADLRDANGKGKVITKIIAYGNGPAGPQPGVPAAEKARFAGPDIVMQLGPMADTPLFNVPSAGTR